MKKHFYIKLALFFSIAISSTVSIIYACYDNSDNRNYSNFTPEIFVDKSYSPLFFTSEMFYKTTNVYDSSFNENIVKDWSNYLQGAIDNKDLKFLLLDNSASNDVSQLHESVLNNHYNQKWARINLKNLKVKAFINFLYIAKEIENNSIQSDNNWDYEQNIAKTFVNKSTLIQVEKLYTTTTDEFLKNRFWFQTIKANFYSSNKENTISFFEKTNSVTPQNALYYRALSYIAGVYYKQKEYSLSNYLYAVVFDKCPELRTVTVYNFHPQEQDDFNASLNLAKTIDEKASLWTLFGYYADAEVAIKEIYELNPKSPHLDLLLTRLINKEEARLNNLFFNSDSDYKKVFKENVNKNIISLVNNIAIESKTAKPYFWNIAAGYLNIFDENYTLTQHLLKNAELTMPKTELSINQIRLLKLMNSLSEASSINEAFEKNILVELNWLYNTPFKSEFRSTNAIEWSKKYLAYLYKRQNNFVYSELFNSNATFYNEDFQLEAMKAFLSKSNKTDWEKFIASLYGFSLSDIYDLQAVTSAYNGNIDQAILYMMQSEGKNIVLLGNPFNGKINDCHDCDHMAQQSVKYTKLSFLQKIKLMQTNIANGVDVYNNSFLLGNAFYNISYYGNARLFYFLNITIDRTNQYILSNKIANSYYKKALESSTNQEQKAKMNYMMSKCSRNDYYNSPYYKTEVDFLAFDGFIKLKSEYANTRFYKEVINECGYFKTYLKTAINKSR